MHTPPSGALLSFSPKWNGKPLQYSYLENPLNSMKRQKDGDTSMEILGIYKEVWPGAELKSLQSSSSLESRGFWLSKSGRMAAAPRLEPQRQEVASSASWESCLGHREQRLYSEYLLLADSAGLGLAQGSIHYLLIFTTFHSLQANSFWVS